MSEFFKDDTRWKLKECQGIQVQLYQHLGGFVEGDRFWYQPINGNYWLGPAAVLCQLGQYVWIHVNRDMKKVPKSNVKLCMKGTGTYEKETIDSENMSTNKNINEVTKEKEGKLDEI